MTWRTLPVRCLPAWQEDCSLSVHKHVDDLCVTAPSLCVRGRNAGDSAAWLQQDSAFTWESASYILCISRKLKLSTCHVAISDKLAERLSQVYPIVIWCRDCENTKTRDGETRRF